MFSGGVGSWCAARRVVEKNGPDDVVLLFTDTLIEDRDLYRFVAEAAKNIGAPLVRIAEGRDPWQVFFDQKMMGNSRVDLCSRVLKREPADKCLKSNCDPDNTIIYLGIDWTESHRFDDKKGYGAKHRYAKNGWKCEAPMCEPPFVNKRVMLSMLDLERIERPRLYKLGFAHNNCGGFCVKAGIGHFSLLYKTMPNRYRHHEMKEVEFRRCFNKLCTILRIKINGETITLSLEELRQMLELDYQPDMFDIAGCGCFSDGDQDLDEIEF